MNKLTVLHINIIGLVVGLIVGVTLWFTAITGAQETIKTNQTKFDGVETEAKKLPAAEKALKTAEEAKLKAETEYKVYAVKYMPAIGYGKYTNRLDMMRNLFWPNNGKSWPERFRKTVLTYMAQEQKRNGIRWDNPGVLTMGPYGPDPNTIQAGSPGDGLGEKSTGGALHYTYQMSVGAKNLDSMVRHLSGWKNIRSAGVPVVDGFTMTGNSPNLVGTYTLTFTIIVDETIPPADPRIAGGGGGGGGGRGGFGGMTMPPGMMGGGMGGQPTGAMGSGGGGGGPQMEK